MLVLSRRVGEKIEIGNGITVTVLRVTGKSVRIGIEAPNSVPIRRTEIPMAKTWSTPPDASLAESPILDSTNATRQLP